MSHGNREPMVDHPRKHCTTLLTAAPGHTESIELHTNETAKYLCWTGGNSKQNVGKMHRQAAPPLKTFVNLALFHQTEQVACWPWASASAQTNDPPWPWCSSGKRTVSIRPWLHPLFWQHAGGDSSPFPQLQQNVVPFSGQTAPGLFTNSLSCCSMLSSFLSWAVSLVSVGPSVLRTWFKGKADACGLGPCHLAQGSGVTFCWFPLMGCPSDHNEWSTLFHSGRQITDDHRMGIKHIDASWGFIISSDQHCLRA